MGLIFLILSGMHGLAYSGWSEESQGRHKQMAILTFYLYAIEAYTVYMLQWICVIRDFMNSLKLF